MDTKPPTNSYHHQRAPRTPESYFNVPESITLLNIVKSERIQSAFQSNRKNHASVWEMVAEMLNRYSARKRSAKQCCNRYENLKKIYTQLKKNPERHVRRNWPYMFLFKEIEEQRGECWGSNGKRLALISKNHKELSYYHRRRQAAEFGVLLNKEAAAAVAAAAQHTLLQSLTQSTDSNSNNSKLERFLPNHFVEAHLNEGVGLYDDTPMPQHHMVPMSRKEAELPDGSGGGGAGGGGGGGGTSGGVSIGHLTGMMDITAGTTSAITTNGIDLATNGIVSNNGTSGSGLKSSLPLEYEKDANGALNLQTNENHISMKSEPVSEGEFNPDEIQLMQTNYNGSQNFYPHIDPNILHPDVIVDTDNISDCTSAASMKSKRKLSTSTDGDSTNYELIEYLKRREKRDEELLKRMDAREERLIGLLERTVIAIETLANKTCNNNV